MTKLVAGFGSAALILTSQKVQAKELIACHDCHMKRLPKAMELPLYSKEDNFVAEYDPNSTLPLISEISAVRKKLFEYGLYFNMAKEQIENYYEIGAAHTKSTFESLNNEENTVQRVAIIASAGLVGLLFARKRGIFKKILYTSVGSGVAFSAFYPAITKEYALAGFNFSKDQINAILTKYDVKYDTDKIAEDASTKLEYIKSAMKFEGVMKKLNEKFYKKEEDKSKETNSNQDMYTTRSAP